MALLFGNRLGSYEIVGVIGSGGMGEVYRARDLKLQRDVALKVLPDALASDADRIARFRREATVLASLNHPNVGAIYGFEDSGDVHALVLELVEGPTLADRVARGPIPLDEALTIAKQIAEALEAAHEQGIIHRDLKPANIKVRNDGTVKVLDFGLAKLTESNTAAGGADALSMSPTITSPALMSGLGVLLGTAAYMSPEQAKGRPADKRSDIWAFGCVLYEMLTGQRAFHGEDITVTLARVVEREPDWTALPANTPAPLRTLLRRCLQKDRRRRLDSAMVLRLEIEESQLPGSSAANPAVAAVQSSHWWRALFAAAGALLVAIVTSAIWWLVTPRVTVADVTRFAVPLPDRQEFAPSGRGIVAISPDGSAVAYAANRRLYVWSRVTGRVSPVAGSESATEFVNNPTFSPDVQWIAFWDVGTRMIKKIHVTGGAAVEIAESDNPTGMSWNGNDILIGQKHSTSVVERGNARSPRASCRG
jgi:eukaryotic-like serine/threonine-protein kinase